MKKTSLFDSNPYLQDSKKYRDALITSVSSSTAIETGSDIDSISKQIADVSDSDYRSTSTKPESSSR